MKKILSIVLCMLLVISILPVFADGEMGESIDPTLFLKIIEEIPGQVADDDVVVIKVNNSEINAVTTTGALLDAEPVVRLIVPKFGPKPISIFVNGIEIGSHLIVAEESALGYFLTATLGSETTVFSETVFELNRIYTLDLIGGKSTIDNPFDPEVSDALNKFGELEFDESKVEYFIDMPITSDPESHETAYFSIKKLVGEGSYINVIESVQIIRMSTYGRSGNSNSVAAYNSDAGYVRYDVSVIYNDSNDVVQEKTIYINAYHSTYEGLRIETSQVVGGWTHGDVKTHEFDGILNIWNDVYVSAEYALVSLSNTSFNDFKDLSNVNGDPRIEEIGNDTFKLNLMGFDTSLSFELSGKRVSTDEDVIFNINISKKVVSMGRIGGGDSNFEDAYVYYQPDASFPMVNPKALVMLYYDAPGSVDGNFTRVHELVETRVIDFKTLAEHGIEFLNTNELAAFIGKIDVTNQSYGVPTMTTVFLIEGDVSLDSDTFGGVKYGIGDGWNGVFGNYQW
jgi:hypothetical protein